MAISKASAHAPHTLRLDDVLDYLSGPQGAPVIKDLQATLAVEGVDFSKVMGPGLEPGEVATKFDARVAEFLYGSFLLPSQTVAALPQAVVHAFASAADANGHVDRTAVFKALGERAAKLFDVVERGIGGKSVPTQRPFNKFDQLPDDVAALVAKSAAPMDGLSRMPALSAMTEKFGGAQALEGLRFGAVQHLFPTTVGLLDALADNGLARDEAFIMGKNYSTNPDVMHRLQVDGWPVSGFSEMKLLTSNPDGTSGEMSPIAGYLETLLEGLDPKSSKRPSVLLLDEGGKLVKALHEHFPEYAPLCVAVEQTDRGIQVLDEMVAHGQPMLCPVVNVARSEAKKSLEAPMIGENIVDSTLTGLLSMQADLAPTKREACVIGYGAVGRAVAQSLLRRGYEVFVNDVDPAKQAQARADGCTATDRDDALSHGHLLVSCTGRTTLTPAEFDAKLPNRAVLVNAASGNHELGMDQVDEGGGRMTNDPLETINELGFRVSEFGGKEIILGDIAGQEDTFSRVIRTESGNERVVVRSGYVVNMRDDIPPEYIQLTRSLLLGACLQAAGSSGKIGLVALDEDIQTTAVDVTKESLSALGHSLEAPNFQTLRPLVP